VLWVRVEIDILASGNKFTSGGPRLGTPFAGEGSVCYNPATATCGPVDGTGNLSYSGSDFGVSGVMSGFMLVGTFAGSEAKTFTGVGDSIAYGQNNGSADGNDQGAGLFGKSLWSADGTSGPLAGCALVIAGCSYVPFTSADPGGNQGKLHALFKYGKYVVDEMGTNEVRTLNRTGAQALARAAELYSAVRTMHGSLISAIAHTQLLCSTTSTAAYDNGGTSLANQVKDSVFQSGGAADVFNQGLITSGTADAIIATHAAVSDTTDVWKWNPAYIGEASSPNTYLHPNHAGYQAGCVPVRAWMVAQA
jgi:hypothetical protein